MIRNISRDSAVDEIWGLVCGLAEPDQRLLLMLKAYIDDTNMGQGTVAVLAGWIAPARTWANFVKDWNDVLRMSPRIDYFKWNDMRGLGGQFTGISPPMRDEKLKLLVGVLADHNPLGVASVVSNELHRKVFSANKDRILRGPYFLSFYSIITQLLEVAEKGGLQGPVDFVFDIQPGQMDTAVASWDKLRIGKFADLIGSVSFHDDQRVIPLQAADLSAGWTREQAEIVCFGGEPPPPPWGNVGDSLQCHTRTWTAERYKELAQTGGFTFHV